MIYKVWKCIPKNIIEEFNKDVFMADLEDMNVKKLAPYFDDEDVIKCEVMIETIDELYEVFDIFTDDIVIYGNDKNIIMDKYTMKELGLD